MKDLMRMVELGNQVVLVQVQKDLDWATAPVFKATLLGLLNGKNKAVLCHLNSGLIVDSSGLEVIGAMQTRAQMDRTPFGVICSDLNLRRLFKLTRLDSFIPVYNTISEGYANVLVSLVAA